MLEKTQRELLRQLVHMAGVAVAPLALVFGRQVALAVCLAAVAFFLAYPRVVRKPKSAWRTVHNAMNNLERDGSKIMYGGAIWFYLGCGLVLLLFDTFVAAVAITVLALGDSVATMVGITCGRHKLPFDRKKSFEGSLGGFAASFAGAVLLTNLPYAFAAAAIGAVVESLPLRINDNITVPLFVAAALTALRLF